MIDPKSQLFWRAVLITSLLSPFIFFASSMKPWSTSSSAAMLLQELTHPFERGWYYATDAVSSTWNHYVSLSSTAQENTRLKSEVTNLKTRLLDYNEKSQEISRLRKLLGFVQHHEQRHIVAEVVGSSSYSAFRSLRINKGRGDGVSVGMPVVTDKGVVGRIIRTGKKFSDIHLLSDSSFNVDILLQRTRVRGVLQGYGNHSVLTLNRRAEIRIGDTVITSGVVGGFPKGLPVGRVVKISYESDHISQSIRVDPWVSFDRVEEVIILEQHDPEIQKIIESAGKDWIERQTTNAKS